MCLPSHTVPHLNFSIAYQRSVEVQLEIKIICRRGFGSQTTQIVGISYCCFVRLRNVQTHVLSYCSAYYIFCFSMSSLPSRGLLKVPIIAQRLSHQSKFYFHNLIASYR